MRKTALLSVLLPLFACGDDGAGDTPDAAPDASGIDAGPTQRLDVVIDEMRVCPEGWTEGPTAVQEANRIQITAACSTEINEVLLQYSPPPDPGGTAPCTQATLQMSGGPRVNCRVNNQVLAPPEGELTLQSGDTPLMVGECGCMGDEQGGASMGGASFQLLLSGT